MVTGTGVDSLKRVPARLGGEALGAGLAVVAAVRRGRPLHPRGVIRSGRLSIEAAHVRTGVPLLDADGTHECLVRLSRATGVPEGWPDVQGVAVRVLDEVGGHGDLLLAGTGTGRVSRHLLAWRRRAGACSTLLPLASPSGPLLLLLEPDRPDRTDAWTLSSAPPGRPWTRRGRLVLGDATAEQECRFDPVRNPVPGLGHYPVWAAVREPAYRNARAVGHDAD